MNEHPTPLTREKKIKIQKKKMRGLERERVELTKKKNNSGLMRISGIEWLCSTTMGPTV